MNRLPSKLQLQEAETRPAEAEDEYWRPATVTEAIPAVPQLRDDACPQCGTEFLMGAKFCHSCGRGRYRSSGQFRKLAASAIRLLDFHQLQHALNLSAASLVLFIMGIACLLAAIFTGVVYSPATMLDWQAIQTWRLQWLIAAVALFTAGNMLKR